MGSFGRAVTDMCIATAPGDLLRDGAWGQLQL